jgi:hypothetical protein
MINIYTAKEAKEAADAFYGPLGQIFDVIRERSSNGLYVLQVVGADLTNGQTEVLKKAGYDVTPTTNEQNQVVYVVSWS